MITLPGQHPSVAFVALPGQRLPGSGGSSSSSWQRPLAPLPASAAGSQRRPAPEAEESSLSLAAVLAAGLGLGAGLRRRADSGSLGQRRCVAEASAETALADDLVKKLQESLESALEAEATGKDEDEVMQAEQQAREVVLFTRNGFDMFGNAAKTEKRSYSTEDLRDEKVNPADVLTTDDTVVGLRNAFLSFVGLVGVSVVIGFPGLRGAALTVGFALLVGVVVDLLVSQGALQFLVLDVVARVQNPEYQKRIVQAEAARFLVGYLIGVLPKGYSLSAADALDKFQSVNIKSGCVFCSAGLQKEIKTMSISSKSLDLYMCVKLAGVVQEYLLYGRAQTGSANIQQVEELLGALNFEPRKKYDQTNWVILNVVNILRSHATVRTQLAEAMERDATVGECIALVERLAPGCGGAASPSMAVTENNTAGVV